MVRLSGRTRHVTGGAKGIGRPHSMAFAAGRRARHDREFPTGKEIHGGNRRQAWANSVISTARVSDESSVKPLVAHHVSAWQDRTCW